MAEATAATLEPAQEREAPEFASDVAAATQNVETDTSNEHEYIPGPVDLLMGVNFNPTDAQQQWENDLQAVEEATSVCMARLGFAYVPIDPSEASEIATTGLRNDGEGYGPSLQFARQFVYEIDNSAAPVNPNDEIVFAMTESEQNAYYLALYGDPDNANVLGCGDTAFEQNTNDRLWTAFGDELNEMYQQIAADPRVVHSQTEWVKCMTERGHDFASSDIIARFFSSELEQLWEDVYGELVRERAQIDPATLPSDEYGNPILPPIPRLEGEGLADFEAIWDRERAVASADRECKHNSDAIWNEVSIEYQQQFLQTNRDRLAIFDAE